MRRAQLIGFLLSLTPVAGLPAQTDYDLFVAEFQKAFQAGSKNGMEKAVRARPGSVLAHYEAVMYVWLMKREEDGNRELLDKMEETFSEVMDCESLVHVRRFVEGQTPSRYKQVQSAQTNFRAFMKEFEFVKRSGTRDDYLKLVDLGLELARYAEDVGHKSMAADTYGVVANLLLDVPEHTLQDTIDAIDVARLFISCRDTWDWTKDSYYASWQTVIIQKQAEVKAIQEAEEERSSAGLDTSAVGVAQYIDPAGETLTSPLTFKQLKDLPPDSNYSGGPLALHWSSVVIQGQGATALLPNFKKKEVYLVRTGASKVELALDNEAKSTQRVTIASQVKPSLFYLGPDRQDPYCMTFFISGDSEPFGSTQMSMKPDEKQMPVYYRSLSSWETKIAGEVVTFYDDNADGQILVDDPMAFDLRTRLDGLGMKDDRLVASYDSMKVGKGPVVPYSNAVKLGDKWFMIEPTDDGQGVVAKELHPEFFEVGTVKMKWSGAAAVKPQLLIIRGRDSLKTVAFNAAISKGVEVPVGEYEIAYGRGLKGRGDRTQMVSIFKGSSKTIQVEAGKETELALGGPFRYDFVRGGTEDEVVIDSLDIRIVGKAGELYGKIQGPFPDIEVIASRTPDGKRASVVGEFEPITSPDTLNAAASTANDYLNGRGVGYRGLGAEVAFFPVVKDSRDGTTVLRFKLPYKGALIGIRAKKSKLFGKIDPILK